MNYLDDLSTYPKSTSVEARADVKSKGQGWYQATEFRHSLNDAFKIWDAVSEHVKSLVFIQC